MKQQSATQPTPTQSEPQAGESVKNAAIRRLLQLSGSLNLSIQVIEAALLQIRSTVASAAPLSEKNSWMTSLRNSACDSVVTIS